MTWTDALTWRMRRLLALSQRARGSLFSRGWRGTWRRMLQEFRGSPRASSQLRLLPLDWTFAPFAVPEAGNPDVSVIIPVHGHLAHTLACLRSIAACGDTTAFEVIVVDDASPDASAATLAQIRGLRLLGLPRNLGFVGACNVGAAAARGPFLCFLNNDTQVMPGWLDALRACFEDVPGAASPAPACCIRMVACRNAARWCSPMAAPGIAGASRARISRAISIVGSAITYPARR
ncbi:Glycosyl transferase, family 2 domain protein [mine drainage metagenome]|uniref:Glycosyl transferase, family 2 domain protein n=1 Tax=mine drainage metagenome TaxID=410659 RepID=T1B8D4_9ZZZZ